MPKVETTRDFLQRLAAVEQQLAELRRSGWERDEVPFYSTSFNGLAWEDNTGFTTLWETILTPRTASLKLGLVLIGDSVASVNTGGEWRVVLDDTTTVANGTVPPTFSFVFPALDLDLTPYRAAAQLKCQIQVRRTSGATTGGMQGAGGSIGCSPRYARLL